MRKENLTTPRETTRREYGRFPKSFNSVYAHTQTAVGTLKKTEGPSPFWTYSEKTDGGNSEIISFANKLNVGLNGEQIKLLVHYQVLIYQQVANLSANIESEKGLEAVKMFYGNTNVLFDVKAYAEKLGKPYKEVNRDVRENLKVLEDRTYHYYPSNKDETGKTHYFEWETQVLKVHDEVNQDGKKKKNGLILLEVPTNYILALCDSSPLKSFYYEIPDAFYKLTSKNQTAIKLASNALERYNQDHGKNGVGFWKLETAMDVSGLLATKAFKKCNGKEVKVSRLDSNIDLFINALDVDITAGFFEKEGTYFEIREPGKTGEKIPLKDLEPLYKHLKKHGTNNVYFYFQIKGVEDATRKRAKALANKGETPQLSPRKPQAKTVKPSYKETENMDFID